MIVKRFFNENEEIKLQDILFSILEDSIDNEMKKVYNKHKVDCINPENSGGIQ